MKHKSYSNPELIDEDNPEWTELDFARARPVHEVLSASLRKKLGVQGARESKNRKEVGNLTDLWTELEKESD